MLDLGNLLGGQQVVRVGTFFFPGNGSELVPDWPVGPVDAQEPETTRGP